MECVRGLHISFQDRLILYFDNLSEGGLVVCQEMKRIDSDIREPELSEPVLTSKELYEI